MLLCLGITALVCLSVTIFSFQSKVGASPGKGHIGGRTGSWGQLGMSGGLWVQDQSEGCGDVTRSWSRSGPVLGRDVAGMEMGLEDANVWE